jgi:exodeoxyribonuclease-3
MPGVLTVAGVNVNGVRAAARRGMPAWLAQRQPDILCLQEVRAPDGALAEVLAEGWHVVHEEASAKGRAGVAVATRAAPAAVRVGLAPATPDAAFDGAGRWVEADHQIASPGFAALAAKAEIDRAPCYAERWSDHAPVVVEYDVDFI